MLPADIKIIFAQSVLLIVLLRFMLSFFSFGNVRRYISTHILQDEKGQRSGKRKHSRKDMVLGVKLASKYLLRVNRCLIESIVLWVLFKRHGYPADLHIGIRKDARAQLNGHAWVESEGIIAIGWLPDLSKFVMLPPLKWKK